MAMIQCQNEETKVISVSGIEELYGIVTWAKLKGEQVVVHIPRERGIELKNLIFTITGFVGEKYMSVVITDNTRGEYDTYYTYSYLLTDDIEKYHFSTHKV
jgi:hypothetical protein